MPKQKPKKVKQANSGSAIAQEKLKQAGASPHIKPATGADTSVQKLSLDFQKTGQTSKPLNNPSALKQTSSSDPNIPKVLKPTSANSTGAPKKQLGIISGSSSTNGNPPKKKLGKKSRSSSTNGNPPKKKTKKQGPLTAEQQKKKNEGIRKTKERREKQVAEKKAGEQKAANNAIVKQQIEFAKIKESIPTVEKTTALVSLPPTHAINNALQKSKVVNLIKNSKSPQPNSADKLPEGQKKKTKKVQSPENAQKAINAIQSKINIEKPNSNPSKLAKLTAELEKQEAIANPKTEPNVESTKTGNPIVTNAQKPSNLKAETLPVDGNLQKLLAKQLKRDKQFQNIATKKEENLSKQNKKISNLVTKANSESRAPKKRSLFGKFLNKIGVGAMFHTSTQKKIASAMSERERLGKKYNNQTEKLSKEEKKEKKKEKKKEEKAAALAERIKKKQAKENVNVPKSALNVPKSALNALNVPNAPKPDPNVPKPDPKLEVTAPKKHGNTGNTKTKKNNSGTTKHNSTPTKFSLGTNANIAARQKREVEYQKQLGRTSNEQSFLNTQKEVGKLLDFKLKKPETPLNNVSPAFKEMFAKKKKEVINSEDNSATRLEEVNRLKDKGQETLSRKNEELTPLQQQTRNGMMANYLGKREYGGHGGHGY